MLKLLKQILQPITKPAPIKSLRYAAWDRLGNGRVVQFASSPAAAKYCRARSQMSGRPFVYLDLKTGFKALIFWPSYKTA